LSVEVSEEILSARAKLASARAAAARAGGASAVGGKLPVCCSFIYKKNGKNYHRRDGALAEGTYD